MAQSHFTERLACMPSSYLCYAPPPSTPPVVPAPVASAEQGRITFGSFNNLAKLSDTTLDLWASVLAAVPDALALTRARLRGDLAASPLCDATGYARRFEHILAAMWRDWCGHRLALP